MYKKGDLVRVKETGEIYEVGKIIKGANGVDYIYNKEREWNMLEFVLEPVTHLTTKEFITLVEDMGYEVEGEYRIGVKKDEFSRTLATVSVYDIFELNTISSEFKELQNKELLFKILTLYANTPLELREEKEKLYTLELPNTASCYRYYSKDNYEYLFDDIHDDNGYQNKFTQEEIDVLPNQELIKTLKKEELL